MKKNYFILICIICLFTFNTNAETFNKLDSVISYSGDLKTNKWYVNNNYILTYYSSTNLDTQKIFSFYPNGKLKQLNVKKYIDFKHAKASDYYSYGYVNNYDTLKNVWVNYSRTTKTFTSFGEPLITIPQTWDTTSQTYKNNTSGYLYKLYNANNLILFDIKKASALGEEFNINEYQYQYHYNSLNQQDTSMQLKYNTTTSGWENQFKNIFIYDASGNVIENIQMAAKTGGGSLPFVYSKKYVYNYDSKNQLNETTTYAWSTTLGWQYANYYSKFTYDANGKKIRKEMKQPNTAKTALVGHKIHEYTPDAKGNLIAYTQKDTLKTSPFGFRITYRDSVITEYDNAGNLTFLDGYKLSRLYNTDGSIRKDSIIIGSGFSESGYDQDNKRTRYVWAINAGIFNNTKTDNSEINFIVSPNPAIDFVKVEFEIKDLSTQATIKVFDLTGKEIQVLLNEKLHQGKYSNEFRLKNISSGIYLIYMKLGNESLVQKLLIK